MPGGEEDEMRFGADVVNYIEVCVQLDQSQYDKAGDGGRHSHKEENIQVWFWFEFF